jgi:hypothetical protein
MVPCAVVVLPRARARALKAGVPTGTLNTADRSPPRVPAPTVQVWSRPRHRHCSKPRYPHIILTAAVQAPRRRLTVRVPGRRRSFCPDSVSPKLPPPSARPRSMPPVRYHAAFSSAPPFTVLPHPLLSAALTLSVPHVGLRRQPVSSAVYTLSSAAPPSLRW